MIPYIPLPYGYDALEPWMSEATLRLHHDGHYRRYVETVNRLTRGRFRSAFDAWLSAAKDGNVELREQASQIILHEHFFSSMTPKRSAASNELQRVLSIGYGRRFREAWEAAAMSVFGSGWVHLVARGGDVEIVTSKDGRLPAGPLIITMDVWEHAYYLDHPDDRAAFSRGFVDRLVDWGMASERFRLHSTR